MGRKSNAKSLAESLKEEVITPERVLAALDKARAVQVKVSKYPDELKILAMTMRTEGMTYKAIGEKIGVSESSVHCWINDHKVDALLLNDLSGGLKRRMSNRMYIAANTSLSRITDEDYDKASLLQKGTFSAVMIDKARLLDDESTVSVMVAYDRKVNVKDNRTVIDADARIVEAEIAELKEDIDG